MGNDITINPDYKLHVENWGDSELLLLESVLCNHLQKAQNALNNNIEVLEDLQDEVSKRSLES
jgi:hypothetical protein